jgi:hypothetical protein
MDGDDEFTLRSIEARVLYERLWLGDGGLLLFKRCKSERSYWVGWMMIMMWNGYMTWHAGIWEDEAFPPAYCDIYFYIDRYD